MKNILKNKRGDIPSLIIGLIVIMFAVGIGGILFAKVFLAVTTEFKAQPEFSNATKDNLTYVEEKTIPFLDYLFFFSFISIAIGLIISSIYIDVHPALMIIFVIALIVAVVLSGIFANAFVTIGEEAEILSTYNQFVLTQTIVTHLPLLVFVVGLIVVIILYGKGRNSGGGPV
jgi:hypothetical protein